MKKQNGITLIALVITIIILLILAGVTITAVMGENSIIEQAKKASVETRGGSVQERVDLWKSEQMLGEYEDKTTSKTLNELLDELSKNALITDDEKQIIKETGKVTIGNKVIVFIDKSESFKKASSSLENAIALIKTAEGAITETHDMMQRMNYLAQLSVNGSYEDVDRVSLQAEVFSLKEEIDRISDVVSFDGVLLLDGSLQGDNAYKVDIISRVLSIEISDMGTEALGCNEVDVSTNEMATEAIPMINSTFEKISLERLKLGSLQNAYTLLNNYYTELVEITSNNYDEIVMKQTISESGMSNIIVILERISELCDSAIDDTVALNTEVEELRKIIDIIAEDTEFNNQKLLDGTYEDIPNLNCTGLGLNTVNINTQNVATVKSECQNAITSINALLED